MLGSTTSPATLLSALEVAELSVGQGLSVSEISERMSITESKVYRLLRVAKKEGILKLSLAHSEDFLAAAEIPPSAVRELEDALEKALQVSKTVILPVPGVLAGKPIFSPALDERLAEMLGREARRHLAPLVRDGDVIGTGGGRSVYFTAVAFETLQDGRSNLSVASLQGGLGIYTFAGGHPSPLSADSSAAVLARSLGAQKVLPAGKRSYCGQKWKSPTHPLNVGLVGLGAVADDVPNCFEQMRHELDPAGQMLADSIVAKSEEIRKQSEKISPFGVNYFPLGDVLGCPFVVPPPPDVVEAVGQGNFDILGKSVARMANLVYAAPVDQLATIGHLVIVAGGVRKAFPLHTFLTGPLRGESSGRRHSLVTDYWTAKALLSIAQGVRAERSHVGTQERSSSRATVAASSK